MTVTAKDDSNKNVCKHCGVTIVEDPPGWWSHFIAPGSVLRRCDPAKSGQPYGLDAEPSNDGG